MSISLRVTGTWAELIADGSVAIPSTPQAGDRMYLFARWKDFSITASVANWTEITQFADGAVGAGNGTGSVKVACWYRDWQSGDTDPTIDFSASPDNASVVIMVMQKDADDVWGTPLFVTAAMTNWTTSSQSVSASSTLAVPGGSIVMGLIGIRDDTATMTRPTNGIDDSGGAITWNGDYVESPATHHSTTTGFDGAADLGYRLVTTGATATLRMTGTISAAETGAALWVIQGITIVVTPAPASFAVSTFTPTLATGVTPATANLAITTFAPSLLSTVTPPTANFTISTSSPQLANSVTPAGQSFVVSTSTPTLATGVTPAKQNFTLTTFAPAIRPFDLVFADPGGDAVQVNGYFATPVTSGTGSVSFDTTQKVVGVGSYKFDSGVSGGTAANKVSSVLGQAGRIQRYVRFDSVPNTNSQFTSTGPETSSAYSGGGFADASGFEGFSPDDNVNATATPAKNSAQGSALEGFFNSFPFEDQGYIVDSIKIIYERFYTTASSIGISRVRWLVDGIEGPNHDNTDMPTDPTVVEVDITTDRTWTPADINSMQVIAEALRGDTDTPHTQNWDYVVVRIDYHASVPILWGQTALGIPVLRLEILPSGSGIVFRLGDSDGNTVFYFDGITVIPPNEWHRVTICYLGRGVNDMDVKLFVDGIEELSLSERPTFGQSSWPDLVYGWLGGVDANRVYWSDQLYIDNVDDLTDPGPRLMTNKSGATVNADNFDTTGGTGAVNERPVNLANYRQQAGASQVLQNYTLQAANVGDVDISDETYIGYMGWAIAKKGSGTGTGAGLTANGVTTDITLTTTESLYKAGVFDTNYPSNAAGIGMRSIDGDADTTLAECGLIEVYHGPPEDILFARYLLLAESNAEVIDDLRASPPSSYMLRYWIWEGGGSVTITAYSITAEGESPRKWPVTSNAAGGSGQSRIGVPGIEVRIVIEVSGADTYVMLQGYPNL